MDSAPESGIHRGQRFVAREGMEWEFADFVLVHRDKHPHVALVKPLDRLTRKVISVDALFDRRLFRAVE